MNLPTSRRTRAGARRAAIVSRLFAPESGAAATRLKWLARAFVDVGYTVRVLTSVPQPGSASPDDPAGVSVSRWPVLRDRNGIVRGYVQYLSFDVPLLLRLLLGPRPDVVVCEPPPTTGLVVRLVCSARRVPYVYYAADVWSDGTASAGAPGVVVRLITLVESWVLRGSRLVLSVSPAVTERLLRLGVEPAKVQLVGNGVDVEVFRPAESARAEVAAAVPGAGRVERPPLDVPYAVYAGTMSEWQGADVFVRAFALARERLPADARLVYLGQGSDRPTVERLASELAPDQVDVLGVVPPVEAASWLRHAVCALVSIVPDQGYDFARPTKVWAASASGTPVVFAGRGVAAQEVADAGLGLAVDHDVAAVGEALVQAFSDQPSTEERRRLVAWTRQHASLATVAASAVGAIRVACDQ
ncbi:MAG TPA: glycosyltransferase family 4 protein [Actinomycetales bacterium]|nr:glycosyltransferase family 4 protein [Actinomycetales bacterium]